MKLKDLLAELPKLSQNELDTVIARAKACRLTSKQGGEQGGGNQPRGNWLVDGVVHNLKKRGLIRSDSAQTLSMFAPGYLANAVEASEILLDRVGFDLTVTEKYAFGCVVADTMEIWLKRYGDASPGPREMLRALRDAPSAVEHEFPGYLANGLIGLLIGKRRTAK